MWNIHGKKYDLTDFIDKHPGGKIILENTKGLDDITALFETYHVFSDIEKIQETMKKYEIKEEITQYYAVDFTEYRELAKLVKEYYPSRKYIKANYNWILIDSICIFIGVISFYISYISSCNWVYKYIAQMIYAVCEISVAFNNLHDGAHYGISLYPSVNLTISKIANSFLLWNFNIWFYHHVYYHHSFTGLHDDPDEMYYINNNMITNVIGKQNYNLLIYTILPGSLIGQAIIYMIPSYYEYNIYHQIINNKINNENKQIYDMYDIVLMSIKIYLLYSAGIFQISVYFFTINLLYFINVYPNHSTYETKIENKYEGNNWAKMQICNSGNFLMDNLWWTRLFGGINYQIEHHLFPNMSNIHYPEVSKIVRAYCKERNIPYVNKETLYDAYKSLEKYVNF